MAQQISAAKFLGRDLIIGGGNGQLVLWNTEASRLQNLKVDKRCKGALFLSQWTEANLSPQSRCFNREILRKLNFRLSFLPN